MRKVYTPRIRTLALATAMSLALDAGAVTLTVISNGDAPVGAGTLREMLTTIANDSVCTGAPYVVNFNIPTPPTGPIVIQPLSPYPAITCATTINGYSQPGGSSPNTITGLGGSNAVIRIVIDGSLATGAAFGLSLGGANSVVQGLSVVNFASGSGILSSGSASKVAGNFVGVLPNGVAAGNQIGIDFSFGNGEAGGLLPADRNVVSANLGQGIKLGFGGTARNNLVGVAPDGVAARGNGTFGISANFDGGTIGAPTAGNRIAFNQKGIVSFSNFNAKWSANEIYSNSLIGVDLCNDGPNPNDAGDPDFGCNGLQNSPLITGVTYAGGNTNITATLNTNANSGPYSMEIYGNDDALGQGKVATLCSFGGIATDATGNNSAPISFSCTGIIRNPTAITSGPQGSSEFSAQFLTPDMAASAPSLAFPPTALGSASTAVALTIQNTGLGPLVIDSIANSVPAEFFDTTGGAPPNALHYCGVGSNAAGAPLAGTSAPIASGSACTMNLAFRPQASGARSAALTFNDANSPTSTVTVALAGTGGAVTPLPTTVSFAPTSLVLPGPTPPASTLAINLANPNGAPFLNPNFTHVLPAGLVVANPPNAAVVGASCAGAFSTPTPGSGSFTVNGLSVPTSGACDVRIDVTASTAGAYSTNLAAGAIAGTVLSQAVANALSNTASLAVDAALISLAPSAVNFGNVSVGSSSSQSVTISNTGTLPLNFSAPFAIAGTNAGDFAFTSTCLPAPPSLPSIAPQNACTLNITFTPGAVGVRAADMSLLSNAPTSPTLLPLTGTGVPAPVPVVSLTPASISFPAQTVGTTSSAQVATLANTGTAPLNISSIISSGDFAQSNACGTSLAPAASCAISVTFTPVIAGSRIGDVKVFDDASGSPHIVALSGTATAPPVPTISAPASVTFPPTQVGGLSPATTITVTNTGAAPLQITLAEVVGGGFTIVGDSCTGATVPLSGSCVFSMTFAPTGTGANNATLRFFSNAPTSPTFVGLTGTGTAAPVGTLSAAPATLSFGTQVVGTTSAAQSIAVSSVGSATVTISGVTVSGDYAQANNCATLASGNSCTVSVTFTPTLTGSRAGSLSIASNASNSPLSVTLSGSGSPIPAPVIELSVASLSFGNRVMGTGSTPQPITLRNVGGADLAISRIYASGDFTIAHNCPSVVAPQGSCRLDVGFLASVPGPRTGKVVILSNAQGGTKEAQLSGTGCRFFSFTGNRIGTLLCQ